MSASVRSWYIAATPEVGIAAVEGDCGFFVSSDRVTLKRAVLTVDAASSVPGALVEATECFGSADFEVWVDERGRAQRLTDALGDAGFETVQDTVVLALVGSVRAGPGPETLWAEEVVDDDALRTWATVKLQGFTDSEEPPGQDQLGQEVLARRVEWPVCRYQLAHLGAEPVAVLGHHTGQDRWRSCSRPELLFAASASPRTARALEPTRCSRSAPVAVDQRR